MSSIPARAFVQVNPGVVGAAGAALSLIGMILTQNTRVPIGTVSQFPTTAAVQNYFGPGTLQAQYAANYFAGFDNSNVKPAALAFTQYPTTAVSAYVCGANIGGIPLSTLQALSGTLSVVVDGLVWAGTGINLSACSSYSAIASTLQTALTASAPAAATVTGAIAPTTASVTGSINGYTMTVSAVASGTLVPGALIAGTGVAAGTRITAQLTGATGGVGTYNVTQSQAVLSGTLSAAYGTLTVTAVASGALSVGNALTQGSAGTQITAFGTGTGATGTYIVNNSQTLSSGTLNAVGAAPSVNFDAISGALIITSGTTGANSTMGFASGSLAASLNMTSATGAVTSMGSAAAVSPAAFMNQLIQITTDWASFLTDFNPDFQSGNVVRLAFSTWNGQQNDEFAYVCWDADAAPTVSVPASQSLGQLIKTNLIDGTVLIYDTSGGTLAAFIAGAAASIDFTELNGRITFAYKYQSGLAPQITSQTVMNNLIANGYNCYLAAATAAQGFDFFYPGSVSGQFLWADSYYNEIWLNAALQLALLELLVSVKSIPYTAAGYALVAAACQDPINAGLNFGAIRIGVPLSAAEAAEVNNAAGVKIDNLITQNGFYLQILPATTQVREARQSPPITLWYADGQSIQQISVASLDVL